MSLTRIEDDEIRKIADEITQAADPIELFVRDQKSGRQVSLAEVLQSFSNDDEDHTGFHIPPVDGEKDIYGCLVLMLVHDGAFGNPDSMPARLARLCALAMSGKGRGLSERLAEFEPEELKGPIACAVVATLCLLQGNADRALSEFRHALQLAGDSETVQHDLRLLLDSNNLLGGVCEQVDVKRWVQQATLLAVPFAGEAQMTIFQELTRDLSDASTRQERHHNARLLLTHVYEFAVQESLEGYIADMIETLESRQQQVADRQASDKRKR